MTEQQLQALLDYIDARIDEKSDNAANSSDGGLIEAVVAERQRVQLFKLCSPQTYLPQ